MADDKAPVRRRRLGAHGMMFRRRRIFAGLREGFTYDEIAADEGVSPSHPPDRLAGAAATWGRQRGRAKLQLDRLAPAIQLAAEAIAAGDISAITPYLKALDRLDRYQTVATANQVYDDEARKKLMDKINRMAENFGINEDFAAAVQAHLKAIGEIPDEEPVEGDGEGADPLGSPDFMEEANASEPTGWGG